MQCVALLQRKSILTYTTYMSYYGVNMKFSDIRGRKIELALKSWQHIQDWHPEISLDDIKNTLESPIEIRESPRLYFVELFYQQKVHPSGKERYCVVVVKFFLKRNYISTAMTTNAMKAGKRLYKKESRL